MIRYCIFLLIFAFSSAAFANKDAAKAINDALIYHAYFGTAKATQKLLARGGDPDTVDEHGWPILAIAADRNDDQATPIAKALIDAGANINAAYRNNYPLLNAIKNNNSSLVSMLVAADANLRIRSPEGVSVYKIAKKLGNKDIIYYLEKQLFEEAQTQKFLRSEQHISQLLQQYGFHHCAFNYWGYYLRSKQDKDADVEAIKQRMRNHAIHASEIGRRAATYFPKVYNEKFDNIVLKEREYVSKTLNDMISNRNRRIHGVGKVADMLKRCHIEKTPEYFHAVATQ